MMESFLKQDEYSSKVVSADDYSYDELVKMFESSQFVQYAKQIAEERKTRNEAMSRIKPIW